MEETTEEEDMEDGDQLPVIQEEDEDNDKNPLHQSGESKSHNGSLNLEEVRVDDEIEEESKRSLSMANCSLQNRKSDVDTDYQTA